MVNTQIEKQFGYTRDELLGKSVDLLVPVSLRDRHRGERVSFMRSPEARSMGAGRELFGVKKDGTLFPVEIGLNPLTSEGSVFVLASIIDITQRTQAEHYLRAKILELQRSNEDLQQFAYVCSHDLQEPLRVIANFTQLLIKKFSQVEDEKASQYAGFIVEATKRMQQLINDLLLYSRVQSKVHEFEMMDSRIVFDEALSNLKVLAAETGATFEIGFLPEIKADPLQIRQIFQNLLGNAIKFKGDKIPHVKIWAEDANDKWNFFVEDNGIGFDMKYADRIFIIFQRLHSRDAYSGSGIGLAICKKIAERHGGAISVESEPNKGSKFCFSMPKSRGSNS